MTSPPNVSRVTLPTENAAADNHCLVSVIIPAYNAAEYLADAVRSALDQGGVNVEVVVVNDGSTDGTAAVADTLAATDPRIRVIHQANGHCAAARNAGTEPTRV